MAWIDSLGGRSIRWLEEFGGFWMLVGQTHLAVPRALGRWRGIRLLLHQMFEIGTRSLPVVAVTGMFVGMVLAVQAVAQFKNIGLEGQLGAVVNLSVVRELGPVLAGVLLAGRVGGAITAELGTMRVTEQIDALRSMGSDPVRHLVVPRYLAALLLGPVLVVYADVMGMLGGYYISVWIYDVNATLYWDYSAQSVMLFDIIQGLIKAMLFTGTMALICCHKGFRAGAGAAGVGRACTEAFVASCMVILAQDFVLNVIFNAIYAALYGIKPVLG